MTPRARKVRAYSALALATLATTFAAFAQQLTFMPKGGRQLLLEVVGKPPDIARLREIAGAKHTEAEWRAILADRKTALGEREAATLAAYLEVNMPLPAAALQGDIVAALPADGQALAENTCQSCHSIFTSYLTQSRDVQGWRSIFLSPFHRELKLAEREREEFARYSAINMPMKVDDVPSDIRF